jgi:hypothetical protein
MSGEIYRENIDVFFEMGIIRRYKLCDIGVYCIPVSPVRKKFCTGNGLID